MVVVVGVVGAAVIGMLACERRVHGPRENDTIVCKWVRYGVVEVSHVEWRGCECDTNTRYRSIKSPSLCSISLICNFDAKFIDQPNRTNFRHTENSNALFYGLLAPIEFIVPALQMHWYSNRRQNSETSRNIITFDSIGISPQTSSCIAS